MANIAFYDERIITSQVTIVFIRKLMKLIEKESGNWKLEMLHVEKMKKAKHLEGKWQADSLDSTIYQSMICNKKEQT